jgi:hypothetical protein
VVQWVTERALVRLVQFLTLHFEVIVLLNCIAYVPNVYHIEFKPELGSRQI